MYQTSSVLCFGECSTIKLNCVIATVASLFFFTGWWIMIGLAAEKSIEDGVYILPGLFGTVALIIINIVPASLINENPLYADNTCCGNRMIKTCLWIGFMIAFGTVIGACYVLFNDYILKKKQEYKWPGYGIFLHTLFIFIATIVLRLRRPYDA